MGVALFPEKMIYSREAESTSAPNESDTDQRSRPAQAVRTLVDERAVFRSFQFDTTQRIASAKQVHFNECIQSLYIFQGGNASVQRLHSCLHTEFLTPVPRGRDSDASRTGRAPTA